MSESLYQINTRVWLTELSRRLDHPATLDDIPNSELDRLADMGFNWIWFLSVWQTGLAGQKISRQNPVLRREFMEVLPDLREEDIAGSGFAITSYKVAEQLGGDEALGRLRLRLRERGLRLMLDFVPNHTALDHPWVEEDPDFYVSGSESDLVRAPGNYTRVARRDGDRILAHGRDPYFPGWSDTLQLNYGNPTAQEAITGELLKIAGQCDGVRCDMAMLMLPEIFERTWGISAQPFWPGAIQAVKKVRPGFCFLAEVYWDLEWTLQEQGFDYTYDKRLYDHLREGQARPVRQHLYAGLEFQNRLARFLENHDEPRAVVSFPQGTYEAAAVITFLAPGLRFFQQGQLEGRRRRISPHLVRAPGETANPRVKQFYSRLLELLKRPLVREGQWQLLDCVPAWEGNASSDAFISYSWHVPGHPRLVVAVNYSSHSSQCYVRLPFPDLGAAPWTLRDLLGEAHYEREGSELQSRGLYLDVPPWQYHAFELMP